MNPNQNSDTPTPPPGGSPDSPVQAANAPAPSLSTLAPQANQQKDAAANAAPPPSPKRGIPALFIITLLVLSFLGGLLLAGWYFQAQLQKLNSPKTVTQSSVTVKPKKLII